MKKSKKFIIGIVLIIVGTIGLFGLFGNTSDKLDLLFGSLILISIGAVLLILDRLLPKFTSKKTIKNLIVFGAIFFVFSIFIPFRILFSSASSQDQKTIKTPDSPTEITSPETAPESKQEEPPENNPENPVTESENPNNQTNPDQEVIPNPSTEPEKPTEAEQPKDLENTEAQKKPEETATPEPSTETPTVTEEPSSAYEIQILSAPNVLHRNDEVTLQIHGKPNTKYSLAVYYNGNKSSADGLGEKISDANGIVTWGWHVGGKTKPGTAKFTVSGDGNKITREANLVE